MFFKKIALFVMTAGLASGILVNPLSADAKTERVKRNNLSYIEGTDSTDVEKMEISVTETPAATESPEETAMPKTSPAATEAPKTSQAGTSANVMVRVSTPASEKSNAKAAKSGKTKKKVKKYKKSELRLMASIINCEAGGESFQGQVAVGIVVMNRVKSEDFPNTIKKVIYQKGQFSPVRNGSLRRKLNQYDAGRTGSAQWKSCIKAAKKVLKGQSTIKLKGKTKNMKGVRFFSVSLKGAKFRLGGHRFR